MRHLRWLTAVAACALLVAPSRAREVDVLHVPGDYLTIQAAVDAAHPGDHIRVVAGVYNENVVITTSNVSLEASDGVVLDGSNLLGPGVRIAGTAVEPLAGVRVAGFEIRHFEHGIVASRSEGIWIHRNDIHDNLDKAAPFVWTDAFGVDLQAVRYSRVSGNLVHDNGGNGIAVRIGSAYNSIRANRISGNAWQSPDSNGAGVLVTGNLSEHNDVLANEIRANFGWGIQIARPPGLPLEGILVAQNRLHENLRAGIAIMGAAVSGNTILQNNATGNQTGGITTSPCWPFDLFDEGAIDNTWARNQGTAAPGVD